MDQSYILQPLGNVNRLHDEFNLIVNSFCYLYSETCVSRTSLLPASFFGINRRSGYTGQIMKDFLH